MPYVIKNIKTGEYESRSPDYLTTWSKDIREAQIWDRPEFAARTKNWRYGWGLREKLRMVEVEVEVHEVKVMEEE